MPEITDETYGTVVILNLRGYDDLGSTFLTVLERYTADLQEHRSKLMLAGVSSSVEEQLENTGLIREIGRENVYRAAEQIGKAALDAWDAAEKWVVEQSAAEQSNPTNEENGEKAQGDSGELS